MSIIVDSKLLITTPQTHVLIVGVGDYWHLLSGSKFKQEPAAKSFGLSQLTSPAPSATAFAKWLLGLTNTKAPLGTVEMLQSPSQNNDINGNPVDLPTMSGIKTAFRGWSQRANANPKNVAIFYYCGHGLEKDGTTILLPCDFGNPAEANISTNMIDFDLTFSCNVLECSAETQLYLVDACRETPTELLALRTSPVALISTTKLQQLRRDAPIIKAANSGMKAHAKPGAVSFFTEALIACLDAIGARGQNGATWEVATSSLGQAMKYNLQRMKIPGLPQLVCDVTGKSNFDTIIHTFSGPATVMSSIECDPDAALPVAEFMVRDGTTTVKARTPPEAEPYDFEVPAGRYDIEVKVPQPPYVSKVSCHLMQPPFTPCTLKVDI